jgi:hypothetical protein
MVIVAILAIILSIAMCNPYVFIVPLIIYIIWFIYANFIHYTGCPSGSTFIGVNCTQKTGGYWKAKVGKCKKGSCSKAHPEMIGNTALGCTCTKPCISGFKRQSAIGNLSFCSRRAPWVFIP